MQTYRAPLADFAFLLRDVFDHDGVVATLPPYADAPLETVMAVLTEAAAFSEGVLLPLNRTGDEQGCAYRDGAVRTPAGFRAAYAALVAGGWPGLGVAPERGGAGLPAVAQAAFEEMACSANLAFATYPLLSAGAAAALTAHGSAEQVERYVPRLASGEWSGTMCLTEAQAGTDLGLLRTRAEPGDEGTYRITGTKVFTSCWPGCPTRRRGRPGSHSSSSPSCGPRTVAARQTASPADRSSTRWASAARPRVCCTSRTPSASSSARRTPAWRRCSR
jgi:hypothetical protein